jgi:hypothetical protein
MEQAMVAPPTVPVLLHWASDTTAALAGLPPPAVTTKPSEAARTITNPGAIRRSLWL